MKTKIKQADMPPEGTFPFVLIQGLNGSYRIEAGFAAQDAVKKDERGLLEGIVMSGGNVVIKNNERVVYTLTLDEFGLPHICRIMNEYARQIGYESRVMISF